VRLAVRLPLVCLTAALAACTTAAQRQYHQITENNRAAGNDFKACVSAVYNSPGHQILNAHEPLDIRDATLDQMTDGSKATPSEIEALKAAYAESTECRKSLIAKISQTTPTIAVLFADAWQRDDAALIELIQDRITWGEFVSSKKELYTATLKEVSNESKNIDAGLQRSNDDELARRQAGSIAMMQYLQTQQMIRAMNKPVITNCSEIGNTVNCFSR
jgi:hypothetical protein